MHNSVKQVKQENLIQYNVPLHDKNWFGTGGTARLYSEPKKVAELVQVLQNARKNKDALFFLGQGANILMSDDGFDGLVVRPALKTIDVTDETNDHVCVTAGAGATMHDLIEWCLQNNITGLEEFSGIPGTVGGSVYINLHYYQFLLEHFLVSAHVLDVQTYELLTVNKKWFNFGYNKSTLQEKKHILVNATFKLNKVSDLDAAYAHGRRAEIIRHRTARYPSKNTCGSFFRNFLPAEVTITSNGKKMIYVAYYLDKIGVKGQLSVGNAIVSYQHANMIVNQGNATSSDIVNLARAMQQKVKDAFGIVPQPECQLIGFKEYPLL